MSPNPPQPTPDPAPRTGRRATLVVLLVNAAALAFAAVQFGTMRRELDGLGAEVEDLRHAVDLYRYERTSQFDGLGFNALLDHLTHWAPELQRSSKGTSAFFEVEKRVRNIVDTMGQLPGVYPQIEATFRSGGIAAEDPATDDEIRKWLLRAARIADPDKTRQLYADLARAEEIDVSGRLRRIAVMELLTMDKQLTGEILHEILTTESATGVGRPGAQGSPTRRGKQPQFYNFIEHYVATGHPQIEATLQMILGRPEHDLLTLQAAATALGDLGCKAAAPQLMKLYEDFRSPHLGRVPNPLFRRKVLDALVKIKPDGLAEFLRKVERVEGDPGIRAQLTKIKTEFPF